MPVTLLGALACLVAWAALTFIVQVPSGLIHVLLAAGVILIIRWYALRDSTVAGR